MERAALLLKIMVIITMMAKALIWKTRAMEANNVPMNVRSEII